MTLNTCPHCGANLDPAEKCTCQDTEPHNYLNEKQEEETC